MAKKSVPGGILNILRFDTSPEEIIVSKIITPPRGAKSVEFSPDKGEEWKLMISQEFLEGRSLKSMSLERYSWAWGEWDDYSRHNAIILSYEGDVVFCKLVIEWENETEVILIRNLIVLNISSGSRCLDIRQDKEGHWNLVITESLLAKEKFDYDKMFTFNKL